MPAVRKVIATERSYWEGLCSAMSAQYEQVHRPHLAPHGADRRREGAKVAYGQSYPAFPPARKDPQPEEFYSALLGLRRVLGPAVA